MYLVQPKLLKHCTLTVRGVSIIYYISPMREELPHSEHRKNPERRKIEPRQNTANPRQIEHSLQLSSQKLSEALRS